MIEFTGERVIPGQVDVDLWNEHRARYAFAARLAAGKRVLDAGCGAGYGSALLAEEAASVTGIDVAPEAIVYATEHYAAAGVRYLEGSCSAMPLPDAAFDLVVSFEVIEHLADWQAFLLECRRVLAPDGVLLLSTPNRDTYAEARRLSGPNPFHAHEFDFDEFRQALEALFPHVHLYLQNHVEGIAFQPASSNGPGQLGLQQPDRASDPHDAHFFLAACSASPHPAPPPFVYVPTTANVLREREVHIAKLATDVDGLRQEKEKLVEMFRQQEAALEAANRWSRGLDERLAAAATRIEELDAELQQTVTGYQVQVSTLDGENRSKTEWARELDQKLAAAAARILELQAESDAKNAWAVDLDQKLAAASARIVQLQDELQVVAGGYAAKVADLEAEMRARGECVASLSVALADQQTATLSRISDLEAQLSQMGTSTQTTLDCLQSEICSRSKWGQQLQAELEESNLKTQELERAVAGYAAKVAQIEAENDAKTGWARRLEAELAAKGKDLVRCLEMLHAAEKTVEERTVRMLRLQEQLGCAKASRWVKLGSRFGLGPKLNGE